MTGKLEWSALGVVAVLALAIVGYSVWWCIRAWPRIWGTPRTAYDQMVYRSGARGFGLLFWAWTSLGSPAYDALRGNGQPHHSLARVTVGAVLMFPLDLWLGHWWGRGMAACFGVRKATPAA